MKSTSLSQKKDHPEDPEVVYLAYKDTVPAYLNSRDHRHDYGYYSARRFHINLPVHGARRAIRDILEWDHQFAQIAYNMRSLLAMVNHPLLRYCSATIEHIGTFLDNKQTTPVPAHLAHLLYTASPNPQQLQQHLSTPGWLRAPRRRASVHYCSIPKLTIFWQFDVPAMVVWPTTTLLRLVY